MGMRRFPGVHYNGRDAARTTLTVTPFSSALRLEWPGGAAAEWPYDQVRLGAQPGHGDPVRLERTVPGQEVPETLVVVSPDFCAVLRTAAPAAVHLHVRPAASLALRAGLAAAAVLALAFAAVWFALPRAVDLAAGRIPVEWERQLGARLFESLAPPGLRCGAEAQTAVDAIVARLQPAGFESPYRFQVALLRDPQVNAFALPGGYVAVHAALLARTSAPEELAGVLAHEMEHVAQRHSTRAVVRALGLSALLTMAFGDLSGALEAAHTLGQLHFQRRDEESADRRGLERLMAARIDPGGMIRAFRMLESEERHTPRMVEYLSTHPPIEGRIRRLERAAAAWRGPAQPLLPGTDWKRVAAACAAPPPGDIR